MEERTTRVVVLFEKVDDKWGTFRIELEDWAHYYKWLHENALKIKRVENAWEEAL